MSPSDARERTQQVDAITVEVIRGFLETVADEMSLTMKRTAVTPIFSESSDYSCTGSEAVRSAWAISRARPSITAHE